MTIGQTASAFFAVVATCYLLVGCDKPCIGDVLADHYEELTACDEGDVCVIPERSCHCFVGPYNSRKQALWDELESEGSCESCGLMGFCPEQINPRCEAGRCESDDKDFPFPIDAGAELDASFR